MIKLIAWGLNYIPRDEAMLLLMRHLGKPLYEADEEADREALSELLEAVRVRLQIPKVGE